MKPCEALWLTLFMPSKSEWVASSSPSDIGAKRSKVGMGQEKLYKNAHILTVNISVLPSVSVTISLFLPSLFRTKHPSIVRVINFMLAIIIHEKYILIASETNISLTSHHIFADLNVKTMQ